MTVEHRYPSNYGPGQHWALDEAWRLLDMFKPGTIPHDVRCMLAGMITGTLMKAVAEHGNPPEGSPSGGN
jgi:hypothetical protein